MLRAFRGSKVTGGNDHHVRVCGGQRADSVDRDRHSGGNLHHGHRSGEILFHNGLGALHDGRADPSNMGDIRALRGDRSGVGDDHHDALRGEHYDVRDDLLHKGSHNHRHGTRSHPLRVEVDNLLHRTRSLPNFSQVLHFVDRSVAAGFVVSRLTLVLLARLELETKFLGFGRALESKQRRLETRSLDFGQALEPMQRMLVTRSLDFGQALEPKQRRLETKSLDFGQA